MVLPQPTGVTVMKITTGAVSVMGCHFGKRKYNVDVWFQAANGTHWDLTTNPADPLYVSPRKLRTAEFFRVWQTAPGTTPVQHGDFKTYPEALAHAKQIVGA